MVMSLLAKSCSIVICSFVSISNPLCPSDTFFSILASAISVFSIVKTSNAFP